jgi:hypothetical protein
VRVGNERQTHTLSCPAWRSEVGRVEDGADALCGHALEDADGVGLGAGVVVHGAAAHEAELLRDVGDEAEEEHGREEERERDWRHV